MYPPYHRNFFDGRSPQCNQVLFARKVHAEGPYSAHAPRESPINSAITNAICLLPGAQAVIVRPVQPNLENGKSARAGMRLSFFPFSLLTPTFSPGSKPSTSKVPTTIRVTEGKPSNSEEATEVTTPQPLLGGVLSKLKVFLPFRF